MQVILRTDVDGLGKRGDIVDVFYDRVGFEQRGTVLGYQDRHLARR